MKIPEAWRKLAVATIEAIAKIDKATNRKQPLSKSILEFSQFLAMLAIAGGKELDGGDGHDKSDTAEGSAEDTRS